MDLLGEDYAFDGESAIALTPQQQQMVAAINKKISKGDYAYECFDRCPICENSAFKTLSEKDRYGFRNSVVICNDCGLLFTNPHFDQTSFGQFYKVDYRKLYSDSHRADSQFWRNQRRQGRKIYNYLSSLRKIDGLSIAEVGVGAGGILKCFQERGHDVVGVDYGDEYLEFGRRQGLTLLQGGIDRLVEEGIHVDIIIYSHVFEHILNPVRELEKIKCVLKQSGILYVEVPGVKDLDYSYKMNFLRSIQNAHVYYFTLNSLTNCLALGGFSLIRGDQRVRAVFERGERKTDLVYENASILDYLRAKERSKKKRLIGMRVKLKSKMRALLDRVLVRKR